MGADRRAAALKMDEHVGHKVSITGHVIGAGAGDEDRAQDHTTSTPAKVEDHQGSEDGEHERHLQVKSMKHIAATCP
jgi:hypothetical protein